MNTGLTVPVPKNRENFPLLFGDTGIAPGDRLCPTPGIHFSCFRMRFSRHTILPSPKFCLRPGFRPLNFPANKISIAKNPGFKISSPGKLHRSKLSGWKKCGSEIFMTENFIATRTKTKPGSGKFQTGAPTPLHWRFPLTNVRAGNFRPGKLSVPKFFGGKNFAL